jgi:hypothetical protein
VHWASAFPTPSGEKQIGTASGAARRESADLCLKFPPHRRPSAGGDPYAESFVFNKCCSTTFAQQLRPVVMGDGGRPSRYVSSEPAGLASGPAPVSSERNVYVNRLPATALCLCAFVFFKIRGRSGKILWLPTE